MEPVHPTQFPSVPQEHVVERATDTELRPLVSAPPPRRSRPHAWIWSGALIAVASGAMAFQVRRSDPEASRPELSVPSVRVATGTLERRLRLTGTTTGEHSVTLLSPYLRGSRTRGGGSDAFHLVLEELVDNGARVQAGEIVAIFDRVSMLQRIDNHKAERDQAAGTLAALQARLAADREARSQLVRTARADVETATLDLKTAPVRTAIESDLLRLSLEEARMRYSRLLAEERDFTDLQSAQLRGAQLNLELAEFEVKQTVNNSERMVVRAPRAGIAVVRTIVRNGENSTTRAGDELHAGQPYLDIVASGPMIVEATVNQVDVRDLRIGAPAEVAAEAIPGLSLKAEVISIGSIADSKGFRGSFVREVPVRLRVSGSDPRLLPSLTVSADVLLGRLERVTVVPRRAVFPASSGTFALVHTGERWEKRSVSVGMANHIEVAVLSGLKHGDLVATALPDTVAY